MQPTPPFSDSNDRLHLALPKGRMQDGVRALLAQAGVAVRQSPRDYRPVVSLPGVEAKILKPQNIVRMLAAGTRDLGFAGADWVAELGADLVEVLDTGLDPVRLVAAAPESFLVDGALPDRPLVIASEYAALTRAWIRERNLEARFVRSFGATEVFPPEDADCIVDNTATGSTLRANNLAIVDTLMTSSTRLYASRVAYADPTKRARIADLALLLEAVLAARRRAMVELNVAEADLPAVIDVLPCMREPTVAQLAGGAGFAVKAAVPRDALARIVPLLKARGASDLVVSGVEQIIP